jgi:hypothetical protein
MTQMHTEQPGIGRPKYPNYITQARAIFLLLLCRAVAATLLIVRLLGAQSPSSSHPGESPIQIRIEKQSALPVGGLSNSHKLRCSALFQEEAK